MSDRRFRCGRVRTFLVSFFNVKYTGHGQKSCEAISASERRIPILIKQRESRLARMVDSLIYYFILEQKDVRFGARSHRCVKKSRMIGCVIPHCNLQHGITHPCPSTFLTYLYTHVETNTLKDMEGLLGSTHSLENPKSAPIWSQLEPFLPDQFLCDPAVPKFGFMTFAKRGKERGEGERGREARTLHKSGADGTNSND